MKLMVVDDHAVVRKGLATFLSYEPDIEVVGSAASGEEALVMAAELRPEVVLMDVSMPGIGGIEATRLLVLEQPEVQVVMLTSFGGKERIDNALENGAVAYVVKDTPPEELLQVLRGLTRPTKRTPMGAGL